MHDIWSFSDCNKIRTHNHLVRLGTVTRFTARKMKFSIKDFSSKCDQIRSFLRIWSHLLEKSLMENFILCVVFSQLG